MEKRLTLAGRMRRGVARVVADREDERARALRDEIQGRRTGSSVPRRRRPDRRAAGFARCIAAAQAREGAASARRAVTPRSVEGAKARQTSVSPPWVFSRATRSHARAAPLTPSTFISGAEDAHVTNARTSSPSPEVENAGELTDVDGVG